MMKRLSLIMVLALGWFIAAPMAHADSPKVTWGGLFYVYNFFHKNTDFDTRTEDGNSFMYIHGDIQYSVDFGNGVSIYSMIGAWGQHGANPYWGTDLQGNADPGVRLLQAYMTVDHLFDSNWSLRMGKERLLYGDGMVFFDGGEDGAIQAKLMYRKDPISLDLFYCRLAQSHGIAYVGGATYGGYNTSNSDQYPGNINAIAAYGTYKLNENMNFSFYGIMRPQNVSKGKKDNPIWLGARLDGSPIGGVSVTGEFTLMSGKSESSNQDYAGRAMLLRAGYAVPNSPVSFGGAYVSFSGDKTTTSGKNELYESVTNGPFTYGFYKDWPGFGPAHLMTTGYGFAGLDPGNTTMTNLNVINAYVKLGSGPFAVRFDFFNYSRNWVPSGGNKAMGNEFSVLATYNYKDSVTFGFTGGLWMPGDYWKKDMNLGDNAGSALGGYFYFAKAF